MPRRPAALVVSAAAIATLVAPAVAVAAPGHAPPELAVKVGAAFSPNGDGVRELLPVRVRLSEPARVTVTVAKFYGGFKVRTVRLGRKPAGATTWRWDGRTDKGRRASATRYVVTVRATPTRREATGTSTVSKVTYLDNRFDAELTSPTFGVAADEATYRVFPRSTDVSDAIDLEVRSTELAGLADLRLVVRSRSGRIVRTADVNHEIPDDELDSIPDGAGGFTRVLAHGGTVAWKAVRGGKPLPQGRYTAQVVGRDHAGNTGRSQVLKVYVSSEKLVWKETTSRVTPSESLDSACSYYPDEYRCGGDLPDCGEVVPSAVFPGGLSYRSRPSGPICGQPFASAVHALTVPEATGLRGLDAVRVAFTGAPTTAGEADTGTLRVLGPFVDDALVVSQVVGTSGRSEWVSDPSWGEGLEPEDDEPRVLQRDPAAVWTFATSGDDAVDVGSFTVDVRYLVIEQ